MRILLVTLIFSITSLAGYTQSSGLHVLKKKFKGEADVHAFKLNGLLARLAIKMIDDEPFQEAVSGIRSIEFISIPRSAFDDQHLSVQGYKKFLLENRFESLMDVRDNGEHISVLLAPDTRHERYVIIVDEGSEVIVFEMKGHIDPAHLTSGKITSASL